MTDLELIAAIQIRLAERPMAPINVRNVKEIEQVLHNIRYVTQPGRSEGDMATIRALEWVLFKREAL